MESIKKKLEDLGIHFSESYSRGSSFLLSDGTFCNLTGQDAINGGNGRIVAHHQLDRFIHNKELITEKETAEIKEENAKRKRPYFIISMQERILKFTDGACIMNDGSNYGWENCYVDMPFTPPTGKQLEQLILWIDDRHYKNPSNKRRLDISVGSKVLTFDLDQDSTDDIMKEVRKLYSENLAEN